MGAFYRQVPLIGVLAVVYLILAAVWGSVLEPTPLTLFTITLPSEAQWKFGVDHLFEVLGLVLLYLEILKSTRTGRGQIIEHIVSMLVFVGCLLLFILVKKTGSSTFLLITLMSGIDVVAGFTVGIIAARRDLEVERVAGA
jgi:hypothetical protein